MKPPGLSHLLELTLFLGLPRAPDLPLDQLFSDQIPTKVLATAHSLPAAQYPQYTDPKGKWKYFDAKTTWTSGFFPATLYALNTRKQLCGDDKYGGKQNLGRMKLDIADWLELARSTSTGLLDIVATNGVQHDVGFVSFPFVKELEVNPNNQTAKAAINRFASLLAERFNPVVGCTRSWDSGDPKQFKVIMDNLMNLEVLFHSAELTKNDTLRHMALSHADKTLKNQIREDGGSWHVVQYDADTGEVTAKETAQGFAADSTWSRGESWGVYSFVNLYRHTGNATYLDTAVKMANFFLDNLPEDGIVPWDFRAPPKERPADSSAAMVMANALLMLAESDPKPSRRTSWSDAATKLISETVALSWSEDAQSLLLNGTVNEPAGNALTGTVYGDYYFIQAGNRLIWMGLAPCI